MIENELDISRFQRENKEGNWFLYVVPLKYNIHPVKNIPSIIFIRNLKTKKTYYFSVNHPDSISTISWEKFQEECLISHMGIKWSIDKKTFKQLTGIDTYDVNLIGYINFNELFIESEYELPSHFLIKSNARNYGEINKSIPLVKHLEFFNDLADDVSSLLKKVEPDDAFLKFNDLIIETLGKLESNGIFVNDKLFNKRFGKDPDKAGLVYSQYNVYTSTGRPSNRYGGINYAALNVEDGTRKCFCSRWGEDGAIVVIDYTAFHPRIVSYLTNYSIADGTDIYEYLSRLYFKKSEVDEIDIKEAKKITFRQFYGGIEDKYSHIKYLANLKSFIYDQWEFFNQKGYILTPLFKRKITNKHLLNPNPPKVFNYILQATEGEIAISKLKEVMVYLSSKKTLPVLYTYDAVMYDFYRGDGIDTLMEICRLMGYEGKFPTKVYIGNSYHNIKQMSP